MTEVACCARYDTMLDETGSIMKCSSALCCCDDLEVAMMLEMILEIGWKGQQR